MVTYAIGPFFSNSTFMDDPPLLEGRPRRSTPESGAHEPRSRRHRAKLRSGQPPRDRRDAPVRGDVEAFRGTYREHAADARSHILGSLFADGLHVDDAGRDLVAPGKLGQAVEIAHLAVGELEKE